METIRYSDADLQEFKTLIESKLEKARNELDYLQEQIVEITENSDSDYGGDWMDDSSTTNDVEMLNNMAIRQRKYIRDLENALLRVQNKTYGICMITGQLIDKKRLLAVPTATKSLEAKLAEQQTPERKLRGSATGAAPEEQEEQEGPSAPSERKPKVITKIIRKSSSPKPSRDLDEEFDEIFGKDADDSDEEIDTEDVNLDEIADEDDSFN